MSFILNYQYALYKTSIEYLIENKWFVFEMLKPICIVLLIRMMHHKEILAFYKITKMNIAATIIITTLVSILASL